MDCHRCCHIRYDGVKYGRCSHPDHLDVKFIPKSKRVERRFRPYNMQICKDFKLVRKCSNCKNWIRGEYYNDGVTPAKKGRCSLRCFERGADCPLWEIGPTSWVKRVKKND